MRRLERIMLVDDDVFTNFYNEVVLKRMNAYENIIVFQNGKEALDYLKTDKEKVDLILLDINMPIMNGWQFLEHYGEFDKNHKATIVMLTSSVNIDDKKKAEGFKDVTKYVSKPLNAESIKEILAIFE